MKFDHAVLLKGVFYPKGVEVPYNEPTVEKSTVGSTPKKYTEKDVDVPYMTLKSMCKQNGISVPKTVKADEMKKLLLEV